MSIKRKRLSLGMVKTQGRLWNIFSNFLHFNLYKQENIFCYVLSVIRCECYNLKVIGSYQLWSWEHKIILFYLPSIFSTTNSADFNQAIHTYISTFPWKSHFSTAIINPVLFAIFTIVYLLFFFCLLLFPRFCYFYADRTFSSRQWSYYIRSGLNIIQKNI